MQIRGIVNAKIMAADVKAIIALGLRMFQRMLPMRGPMIDPEPNAADVAPNPAPLFVDGMLVASHEE